MSKTPIRPHGVAGIVVALAALGTLIGASGCGPSPPDAAMAQQLPEPPAPTGALPDVTVTLGSVTRGSAESTGRAWYVTAVRDPVRGSYTAAIERRSANPLWFDAPNDGEQRAAIALVLRNGRPADLLLSVERGRFVCRSQEHDNACALRVSVDDTALRPVWFAVPRHSPPTYLHLRGGGDSSRLLAALAKAKQLRIQATFEEEGSPEIEFGLAGLHQAIGKVIKRSVAATPKLAAAIPGA